MLTKGSSENSDISREEWAANERAQIRRMHERDAARTTDAVFIETAKSLCQALLAHNIELWTLHSSVHEHRLVARTEKEAGQCYAILSERNQKNQDISTSLNNLEFGHPAKLGDRLLPALEGLVTWCEAHQEMAGRGGLFASTPQLKAALETAKTNGFFDNLPKQARGWAL